MKMEKKAYMQPTVRMTVVDTEGIMITASPGVGGSYDPEKPMDAKQYTMFPDEPEEGWLAEDGGRIAW